MINVLEALHKATEIYEPNDAVGIVGLIIIGMPTLLTAAGTVWVLVRQGKAEKKIDGVAGGVDQTNKQVVNGHGKADPLRVDLDNKFAALDASLTERFAELHTAVAVETASRATADKAIGKRLDGIETHLRVR